MKPTVIALSAEVAPDRVKVLSAAPSARLRAVDEATL